ncbi:MAG: sugar ABC transporter permease [Ruminiclostridium sp.]|nr:sugar ABC transporter permease [Ruminiclostridium sp.]
MGSKSTAKPGLPKETAEKRRLTLAQKKAVSGLLFIAPWVIGFIVYYARGIFMTLRFALSKVNIAETGGFTTSWVGFGNFRYALMEHGTFNQIFVDSLVDILIDVPFIIFFSLFIAILLNSRFKGRGIVRVIFFIPILLGSGAILETLTLATENIQQGASAMVAEFSPPTGVNVDYFIGILIELGLPMEILDYVVGLVSRIYDIVRSSSVQTVIFLAALQSISPALYEVSKIEGATTYETFWKVTFPMVTPLILTNVVYTIVDSYMSSEVVTVAIDTAFNLYEYGLSSAMTSLSTAVVCVILTVVCVLLSKKTFYYN